ncbi:MAG: Nif3-like dinuclear metal center hexameric protein [Betaproteobacteria bacterium]|nr:Nif3-like dinuclear metal center hexameric protein [Betaproteobacteria bacterium]
MVDLFDLVKYTKILLDADEFRDYCPNGLQVEGRREVRRLMTAVSADLDVLDRAVQLEADCLLVHHGYFWKQDPLPVVGIRRNRLARLLKADLSLMAFHLPLDAHRALGNNAQLGLRLGIDVEGWFGDQAIGAYGALAQPRSAAAFVRDLEHALARPPLLIGRPEAMLRRVAWCTGAAHGFLGEAIELGVDAFVTGELSEPAVHVAREAGIALIGAGHHATERYGVQALGEHLASRFALHHHFLDSDNPV